MYSKSESYKDSSALAGNWEIDTVFYIQLKRLKNKRKVLFIKSVKVSMVLWPTPNDTIYEYHGMEYITNELYAVDDDVVNKKGNTFDIDDLKDRDKKGILNVIFMDKIDLDDSTRIGSIIGRYTTDRNNEFVAEAKKELEKQPDRKCKILLKPCSANTYCMAFNCSNNLKYKKTLRKVM